MALPTALGIGAVAAVAIPWLAERNEETLGGLLEGQFFRLPVFDTPLHWSWLIFSVVTMITWASLAVVRTK